MTEKELFNQVNSILFKDGSCETNKWFFIKIIDEQNRTALFEAMQPNRGNIRIRKPMHKMRTNDFGQEIWAYSIMRFTNKCELKYDGIMEAIRLDQEEVVT